MTPAELAAMLVSDLTAIPHGNWAPVCLVSEKIADGDAYVEIAFREHIYSFTIVRKENT